MHRLLTTLHDAGAGIFPEVDGGVTYLPAMEDGQEAVVCFTGHAFVASRLGESALSDLAPDGFGRALHSEVLLRLAGQGGKIGSIDATLVATGRGGGAMRPRSDLDDHPRVAYARARRRQVLVYGEREGLFTMSVGLGGRREMSVETTDHGPSGRELIEQALTMTPSGDPLFAAVAPGNARSFRWAVRS